MPKEIIDKLETEEQLQEIYGIGNNANESEQNNEGESDNESNESEQSNSLLKTCITCEKATSGAHACSSCGRACHAVTPCSVTNCDDEGFGSKVICLLCNKRRRTEEVRTSAKQQQQSQAEKMKTKSAQRFAPATVGQTVMVPIPEVDRGRADHRNIKAVVLSIEDGFYKLGTSHGKLSQLYARNQFSPCIETFLTIEEVQQEKEITIREAARLDSVGTGQGFFKCTCTTKCQSKKCKCLKEGVKCNSKCHSSLACCNK